MKKIVLKAKKRDAALKVAAVRKEGNLPGVVYGFDIEAMPIELEYEPVRKAYLAGGEAAVIYLDIEGKEIPVLFKELQLHPVQDTIRHVDFFAVDMKSEVQTLVPLVFDGTAPAVKDAGGIMVKHMDEIEVKCLPMDIPHEIHVDISVLIDFHVAIHVSDLVIPENVEVISPGEETVANVSAPREEEPDEPVDAEGEEGAEGESVEGGAEGGNAEGAAEGGEE